MDELEEATKFGVAVLYVFSILISLIAMENSIIFYLLSLIDHNKMEYSIWLLINFFISLLILGVLAMFNAKPMKRSVGIKGFLKRFSLLVSSTIAISIASVEIFVPLFEHQTITIDPLNFIIKITIMMSLFALLFFSSYDNFGYVRRSMRW